MAEKFIGAQVRAGQFTAKDTGKVIDYNNLVLFTTSAVNCGEMCNDPAKISNTVDNIVKVFGRPITMDWLKSQLGKYVDIFYDKWKKVDRVIFYDHDPNADLYNGVAVPPTASALPVDVTTDLATGALKEETSDTVADLPNEHKETVTAFPELEPTQSTLNDTAYNLDKKNGGKKA